MEEVWRDIEGYENMYQVSSLGNVRSLGRVTDVGQPRNGKYITLSSNNSKGYMRVHLNKQGVRSTFSVHRLVALAFIDNPLSKPLVNHINGVKTDNRVENLEWATHSENVQHSFDTGLQVSLSKAAHPMYKGLVEVYKGGVLVATLCGRNEQIDFGLNPSNVSACLQGKRHTHKGYTFKRIEK